MASTIREVTKSSKRLKTAQEDVLALQERRKNLLEEIEYKKTEEFVEETARNELNFIKPGEEIYIYPEEEAKERHVKTDFSMFNEETPLQEWVKVFF